MDFEHAFSERHGQFGATLEKNAERLPRFGTGLLERGYRSDVDIEVDVDTDRWFGCLRGLSKSVLILFHGTGFDDPETASPVGAKKVASSNAVAANSS